MKNLLYTNGILAVIAVCTLAGCGQNAAISNDAGDTVSSETAAPDTSMQAASQPIAAEMQAPKTTAKREAMKNPEWIPASNLPPEWSGLYQKSCKIGGPEETHFFEYQNHKNNTAYHFTYITAPPSMRKSAKAMVYPISYKVWQNEKWPQHYLLFGQESYSQVLLEDGWVKGLHQTLDGQAWDTAAHWQTKYRETDVVRWAADVEETENYGSAPPCDPKLATPWTGQIFNTKDGKSLTLQEIMAGL